ncbi:glycoside hydrolase family 47 protein [Streptomyces sp. NPDC048664]|uniref:glycoside hydrolase family 47 protein n=1 Tax=Streptomyces sp. NPDC048664 TaxID=3154505 RepID=UPI00341C8FC0
MRPFRSALSRAFLPRRKALHVAGAGTVGLFAPLRSAERGQEPTGVDLPPDAVVAQQVRAELVHSWEGYKKAAWGYDEVRPVSGGHNDFFVPGQSFGLSMVEALDTLWVMELDAEVALAADWIEAHLDPAVDGDVHVFEAVIRLVGGLLSGYLCTGREALLTRCRELADRLLPAFTLSPTGLPYRYVNLRTGKVSGAVAPLAEVGSNILEFGLLSRLTHDARYGDAAKRAYRAVLDRRSSLDLLGSTINVETGKWVDGTSSVPNPPVDSFYEYLWAGAELLGDRDLLDWYRLLTDAVVRRQAEHRSGHLWFRQVDHSSGRTVGREQSELGAFYAGLLGKGGDLSTAQDYYRSWTALLDRYPLLPESIDFGSQKVLSRQNSLRPEYVNSSFDLWRLTGSSLYKATGYRCFQGMRERLRVPGGYTIALDALASPARLGDLTPGYWFAEAPKYLYLMFAGSRRFDHRSGLLSTEGKILRGALRP